MNVDTRIYPTCFRCGGVAMPGHKCARAMKANAECSRAACRAMDVVCGLPDRCPQ